MLLLGRVVIFAAVPALYLALGWLHWERAGRIALLGAAAVLAVCAWTTRAGHETRTGKIMAVLTAASFFAALGFHAFLHDFFGVTPDDNHVIAALFSSDGAEIGEFVGQHAREIAKHAGAVTLACFLFAFLVWWKPTATAPSPSSPLRPRLWKAAVAFSMLFVLLHFSRSLRNQNPLLYFPIRYSAWAREVESLRKLQASMAAAATDPGLVSLRAGDSEPRTVVLVLGESLTRLNFSRCGYARQTTPELDALGEELTWFPDVLSSAASTAPALERMLTPATVLQPDLWLTKPDVLVMARQAGYKTFWLSNHSTDANGQISVFVSHAEKSVLSNKGGSRGEGSYDEVVLPSLEQALRDPAPRKFIVLHLLNAHPAYYFRYPESFARFNDVNDAVTQGLKAAGRKFWAIQMRNYYDNAILYTDHVLRRSLELCRASGQRLAWLFVPDHGQDAAHNSNFTGHNARARSQYEILMIFWRSASFPSPSVDVAALSTRPYQTDMLDHTLLGLMGVSGDYYDARRDVLSENFEPLPRTIAGAPYP